MPQLSRTPVLVVRQEGEAWAQTVRETFPDIPFMSDPLPLSIGCHVGANAVGAAIFTDETI